MAPPPMDLLFRMSWLHKFLLQPLTNPPTGQQMSQQGLAQNDQKCQFWAKFGRFWARIPIFTGGSESSDTQVTEKSPGNLVPIVYWSGLGPNGPKMPIFGQKSQFWAV